MNLKILLPAQVFVTETNVSRVVAEAKGGSFGLLPNRLDCVAALVPGILMYQAAGSPETYIAIDEGVLIKSGPVVLVSVRRAIAGATLSQLREAVRAEFLTLDEDEKNMRRTLAKLESGLIRRFLDLGAVRNS